jgi:pimeloyl-ACP methyl ester carboxylesterase
MATFVLVHGSWVGGWSWQRVTPHLRAAGHVVVTPTLTGLGERSHLLTRDVGLDTHIQDIVNVLEFEDLHEVVLLGHSDGGMVITGVAERVPHRLASLIYLDAWFPIDEDRSMAELGARYMPGFLEPIEARAQTDGQGWMIPTPGRSGVPAGADRRRPGLGTCTRHASPAEDVARPSDDGHVSPADRASDGQDNWSGLEGSCADRMSPALGHVVEDHRPTPF